MRLSSLIEGHTTFKEIRFSNNKERYKELADKGQNPKALFIGCSDSRVMPAMITGSKPGDLFIVRNIGNFVAPYSPDSDFHATAAAIEYAISSLEVSDVIVCGHSQCGAIGALFKPMVKNDENIHTIKWLELGMSAKNQICATRPTLDPKLQARETEKLSILHQLANLLTYPAIKNRLDKKKLFLHGWYYDIPSGDIYYYDNESDDFKLLSREQNDA